MKITDLITPAQVLRRVRHLNENVQPQNPNYNQAEEMAYIREHMRSFQMKDPKDGKPILTDTDLLMISRYAYLGMLDGDQFFGFESQNTFIQARMYLKYPELSKIPMYAEAFEVVYGLYHEQYPEYDMVRDISPPGTTMHMVDPDMLDDFDNDDDETPPSRGLPN